MRAQITVFIIIGLVFLVTLGLVLWQFGLIKGKEIEQERQRLDIENDQLVAENIRFSECARQLCYEALETLGATGLIYPDHYVDDIVPFAYFYHDSELDFPSKDRLESELADYVNYSIGRCLYGGEQVLHRPKDQQVQVRLGTRTAFSIYYQATLSTAKNSMKLDPVLVEIPFDFNRTYGSAKAIAEMTAKDPMWLDAGLLLEQPVNVTMSYLSADTIVYELADEAFSDKPYYYYFAVEVPT